MREGRGGEGRGTRARDEVMERGEEGVATNQKGEEWMSSRPACVFVLGFADVEMVPSGLDSAEATLTSPGPCTSGEV